MPVYNDERYIKEAIESFIRQSYNNFELIITDDVSTDNTYNICKKLQKRDSRLKVYQNINNLGPYKNWETALAYLSGDYLIFATGHDKWNPFLLESYVKIMENDSECILAYSTTTIIDKTGIH